MTGEQGPAAPGADSTVPSVARGYDYLLGGKDNYEIDRQVANMLLTVAPEAPLTARANREFGARAVRHVARQGVRQFIDLGSGIPTTPPAVHEVAREVDPTIRVVYVDFDPVVVAHSNALRSVHPGLATVLADIRQPEVILSNPTVRDAIDFTQPVGVLIFSVLDVIRDDDDPFAIVAAFRDSLPSGSFLAISHLSARSDREAIEHAHAISQQTGFPRVEFRADADVRRFFGDFTLVDPGLVDITQWHPTEQDPATKIKLVGAVGRKA